MKNMLTEFNKKIKSYNRLGASFLQTLEVLLDKNNISYLTISYRVKSIESFQEKIKRKKYSDPFLEIEDICGVRIICYYYSDIEKICKLIKETFIIIESENKEELLNESEFGYRSYHFIAKLNKSWENIPIYEGLDSLKAEIQVRTVLMHAWAEIQHKLAYKKENHLNNKMRRKFSRISAKLEEADEQFEELKTESLEYQEKLKSEAGQNKETFKEIKVLNLDNLKAFLDFYLPEKQDLDQYTSHLLDELISNQFTFEDIENALTNSLKFIKEHLDIHPIQLTQSGVIRTALNLTNDEYWNKVKSRAEKLYPEWVKEMEEHRKKFKLKNSNSD